VDQNVFLQTLLSALLQGSIYALIVIGFTLVFGVVDIVNFAHGNTVMIAMFATYVLFKGYALDPYLSIPLLLPIFFLLGVILYRAIFKRLLDTPHSTHIMVTLGLMIATDNVANFIFGGDLRGIQTSYTGVGIPMGGISLQVARAGAAGVAIVCVVAIALFLKYSDFGKAIRAAASNRLGANLCGINVSRVFTISVGLATALAALAGIVMIPYYLTSPSAGHEFLNKSFAIAVLGGMGSFSGAIMGSMIVALVEAFGGLLLNPALANAIVFGMLICVLLFKPSGLLGTSAQNH
jgi:branched-chain amino acid transport system permease protein